MRIGREALLVGGEPLIVRSDSRLRRGYLRGRRVELLLCRGELLLLLRYLCAGGLDLLGDGVELGLLLVGFRAAGVNPLLRLVEPSRGPGDRRAGGVVLGDPLPRRGHLVGGRHGLELRQVGLLGLELGLRGGELGLEGGPPHGVGLGADLLLKGGDARLGVAHLLGRGGHGVVELLEHGAGGFRLVGHRVELGGLLGDLAAAGVDLGLPGIELGVGGLELGPAVVIGLDLGLRLLELGGALVVGALALGKLLLGRGKLGLGRGDLRRLLVERRLGRVELRLRGGELGLGGTQVTGLGGELRLALGDGRGRRVERGLVIVDLALRVGDLRLAVRYLRLGVVYLGLAVGELGRGVCERLRGVVKSLLGVGELPLGVGDLGLAVVDGLLRVGHDRSEARGRPVGDKPLHLGFVGLYEVSVLVGVRVDALGVLEGHASRHVDVGVELLAHDHGVALEAARAGRRLAHVHDGDDLGRVDVADHGVLGVVQAGLVAQGVGLLAHGDGGADGVLLADVRVDGNLALPLRHAAVDELELGDLVGHAHHAHGVRRAFDGDVLEVAVLDGRRAARLVDGGDVIVVQAVVAQNGEVGQRILAEVGLARGAHVRAGDEKADERERPERHEQHNRYEAPLGMGDRAPHILPQRRLAALGVRGARRAGGARTRRALAQGVFPAVCHASLPYHSIWAMGVGAGLTSMDCTRASCMRITRSAIGAMAALWVTMITVAPCMRLMSSRMPRTCLPVR